MKTIDAKIIGNADSKHKIGVFFFKKNCLFVPDIYVVKIKFVSNMLDYEESIRGDYFLLIDFFNDFGNNDAIKFVERYEKRLRILGYTEPTGDFLCDL